MGSVQEHSHQYANHLPDEILLEILNYIPKDPASQSTLAHLCLVSRQWYNIFVRRLYEEPYIAGRGFDLFVRTICPSLNLHVKRSALSGLVKVLDLTHIVHEGNKATTARLLNRTKTSLEVFKAPRASFGINCWAALYKCTSLLVLDLSLPFDGVFFENLAKTIPRLQKLTELHIPNASGPYNSVVRAHPEIRDMQWPPRLQHLQLSGSASGYFMFHMLGPQHGTPRTLTSLSFTNCTSTQELDVRYVLERLGEQLTRLELRNMTSVEYGDFKNVLNEAPHLTHLTIDSDYMDEGFGNKPRDWGPDRWRYSKPLESLTIVSTGRNPYDATFTALDLASLIDERFLGRLRTLSLQHMFVDFNDPEDIEGAKLSLRDLDEENWNERRWHYAQYEGLYKDLSWSDWVASPTGSQMAPRFQLFGDGRRRTPYEDVSMYVY